MATPILPSRDPELQYLLHLLAAAGGWVPPSIQVPRQPFSWDRWADLADLHGVTGILWDFLKGSSHWDSIPPEMQTRLTTTGRRLAARHAALEPGVRQTLSTLEQTKVPYAVIKGWAHLSLLYGSCAVRPLADLDLWVKDPLMAQRNLAHISFPPGFEIDLHTSPINTADLPVRLNTCRLDSAALWSRRERAPIAGIPGERLSLPDHLLALILDFTLSHGGSRLLLLWEIARLSEKTGWDKIVLRLQQNEAALLGHFTLALAGSLFHTPVPPEVQEVLQPSNRSPAYARLLQSVTRGALHNPLRYLLVPLGLKTWRDRAAFARGVLWPNRRWFEIRGIRPGPLAHLTHWARLSWQVPRTLWKGSISPRTSTRSTRCPHA